MCTTALKASRKIITSIKYLECVEKLKAENSGVGGNCYLMGNEESFIQSSS